MLTADRAVGALVLLEALDVLARGPGATGAAWPLVLLVLAGGGAALLLRPSRPAWAAVLAGAVLVAVDAPLDLRRQHLVLLALAALGGVVARDPGERRLLWAGLVSTLYGAAALTKLNETWLGGDVLAVALRDGPLHVGAVPALAGTPLVGLRLVVFGGLALVLLSVATRGAGPP